MSKSAEEIDRIIAEAREAGKGVSLDITPEGIKYQPDSELKPAQLPWWARLHLEAYAKRATEKPKT